MAKPHLQTSSAGLRRGRRDADSSGFWLPRRKPESPRAKWSPLVVARTLRLSPRKRRLLALVLQRASIARHDADALVGAENTPDVVLALRDGGMDLPCWMSSFTTRDRKRVHVGNYVPSKRDRAIAALALRRQA
jgi:hypothetical protein